MPPMPSANLHRAAREALLTPDPDAKIALTRQLEADWRAGRLAAEPVEIEAIPVPGRPARPELVNPGRLPRRKPHTPEGHAALIHAICHIEFNAINLALDAVYRFPGLPADFYSDWLRVAREEGEHFGLLREHLGSLGYAYGDFPAHNGLWEAAVETDHDPLIRMALVPRVLEARGLDVTPGIMAKLEAIGDVRAVEILTVIQRDEVGHVAIGTRWFRHLCEQRNLEPETTFQSLLSASRQGRIRGPLDRDARRRAGFTEAELDYLEGTG